MMIRRLAFFTALLGAGATVFTLPTMAADTIVNFSGTVPAICSFGTVTPGTLGYSGTNPSTLSSNSTSGGTAGTTSFTCQGGGNVSIATPISTGGTGTSTTTNTATLSDGVQTISDFGGSITIPATTFPRPLTVNMNAIETSNAPLAPGTYNYSVTLTATP